MKNSPSKLLLAFLAFVLAAIACDSESSQPAPFLEATKNYTQNTSIFDSGHTAYGFFPSPPQPTTESVVETLRAMADHADVILFQEPIPWEDFIDSPDGASQKIEEMREVVTYIESLGMEPIFVVDPLNGLNRREFQGLPPKLTGGNFATPEIRAAFMNFAIRLTREFSPRYIGLASEINTYMDAYPEDVENYLSLYSQTYAAIKEASPSTQVFVTFQWDDLNRLDGDGERYDIKWEQMEAFEPELDIWVISSYPYFFFETPRDIPEDYYTPLLTRTNKPLAVAEGGWTSQDVDVFTGTPSEQVEHLQTLNDQLGPRLVFLINLIYADLEWESYQEILSAQGNADDIGTLSYFTYLGLVKSDGTPKPVLEAWDELREAEQ